MMKRTANLFRRLRPQRFYLQVYFALLIALAVGVGLYYGAFYFLSKNAGDTQQNAFDTFSGLAMKALPAPHAADREQSAAMQELHLSMGTQFALYGSDQHLIYRSSEQLPSADFSQTRSGWMKTDASVFQLVLADGRRILGQERSTYQNLRRQAIVIFLLSIATALGTYPVVRRLTRRLENLRNGVEELGSGKLNARVAIEGRDEIADLAISFNQAAQRIEELVYSQKRLLANASHELRSPLARIRMAIELLVERADAHPQAAAMRDEIANNIRELDQLIDEILLASRLDATDRTQMPMQEVNLTRIFIEETQRLHLTSTADEFVFKGDERLLRRMLRNLLENAVRYGENASASLHTDKASHRCVLTITDHGPGIPEHEQDKIFEAFYRPKGRAESEGGIGLGLAIVKQIVELHQGTIVCRSELQVGSSFIVELMRR